MVQSRGFGFDSLPMVHLFHVYLLLGVFSGTHLFSALIKFILPFFSTVSQANYEQFCSEERSTIDLGLVEIRESRGTLCEALHPTLSWLDCK
ncbi:hypothetical protein Scep_024062 [Stephania cephalantha]|uniref:Uncharacterized protein n=1 Tax=Stephania cephalantha TaxID=152367 RepID=A0AAP0HWT1_9MAGN